jgi:1-deoxy-D-xylulose-5-phosphate reductoisomerase
MAAAREGGAACAILNGANEAAVGRFLREEISFGDIPVLVERALNAVESASNPTLADILEADRKARYIVQQKGN